jgi:hypothetical protein
MNASTLTGLKDGSGDMYPEITPITFDVKVKANKSLSQLRFFYGRPEDVEIRAVELFHTVFGDSKHEDGSLTVSLSDATVGDVNGATCKGVAFRSKTSKPDRSHIPLWNCDQEDDKPNPVDYWDIVVADENKRLLIENDVFYILRSKEKLLCPEGHRYLLPRKRRNNGRDEDSLRGFCPSVLRTLPRRRQRKERL